LPAYQAAISSSVGAALIAAARWRKPAASLSGLDRGDRLFHQLGHGAADLVVGRLHALGVEILAQLAEHVVVAAFLEIGHHDRLGVGLRFGAGEPELVGGPQAEQLVAAGIGLEPQFLVVGELLLETFLALVERGHSSLPGRRWALSAAPATRLAHPKRGPTTSIPAVPVLQFRPDDVRMMKVAGQPPAADRRTTPQSRPSCITGRAPQSNRGRGVPRAGRAGSGAPTRLCSQARSASLRAERVAWFIVAPPSRRRGHHLQTGATASRWTSTNHGTLR
jgi:hypothetical protein